MKETYRDFEIDTHWAAGWQAIHVDYDGPEDNRAFTGRTEQEVKDQVDEWHDEQPQKVERWVECGTCYGIGCPSCGNRGQVESQAWRDERDDHLSNMADARRKGELD